MMMVWLYGLPRDLDVTSDFCFSPSPSPLFNYPVIVTASLLPQRLKAYSLESERHPLQNLNSPWEPI